VEFEEFAARQTRPLLGLAIAMSGDAHLAEDIVQEVLVKVHLRWAHVTSLDDPPSYVRKMITNEYLSWRRKWSRVVPFAEPFLFQRSPDGPDDATTLADRDDLVRRLAKLTRRQRAVLALRFFEDLSDQEISAVLGCGEASVRTHASRGLATLRIEAAADRVQTPVSEERP